MTIRETAKRLRQRTGDAVRNARDRIHLPRRRSTARKLFDEAKPAMRKAAPMLTALAVEELIRRWRGASRKKTMKQEIAPILVGLASAAATNPKVRAVLKDAIDAALPKLEAVVAKAKQAKQTVAEKGAEAVASANGDET